MKYLWYLTYCYALNQKPSETAMAAHAPRQIFWIHGTAFQSVPPTGGTAATEYGTHIAFAPAGSVMTPIPCPANVNGREGTLINLFLKYRCGPAIGIITGITVMDGDSEILAPTDLPPPTPAGTTRVYNWRFPENTTIQTGVGIWVTYGMIPPGSVLDLIAVGVEIEF